MQVNKFQPKKSKVKFITQNSMLHILHGTGGIEVDFKTYHDWQDRLIFLEKGQYIKFLSDDFTVHQYVFDDDHLVKNKDFRVLFKHLISLGYIDFMSCAGCQQYLSKELLNSPERLLDISAQQWYWQNPFNAVTKEYRMIFDVKETIDEQFKNHLSNSDIDGIIRDYDINPHKLYTKKVGVTIKKILGNKRLTESKKEIAFTNKSIKEISYDFGYQDPAYFNKMFKNQTGFTPNGFRKNIAYNAKDLFIEDVYQLISKFHTEQRNIQFYADELKTSSTTLSKKVKATLNTSIGKLIRRELIKTAKVLLENGVTVKEIARQLHFEEPNHFSSFFKLNTNLTPTQYTTQNVQ